MKENVILLILFKCGSKYFSLTPFGQYVFTPFILVGYLYPLRNGRYKLINTLKKLKVCLIFFVLLLAKRPAGIERT